AFGLRHSEGGHTRRGHLDEHLFEEPAAVAGPAPGGDLTAFADVDGHRHLVRVLPAHVPDHDLVLDRRGTQHGPPGAQAQDALELHFGADSTGHLNGDVDALDETTDQLTVPVVAVAGGIEVDDVETV